MVLRERISDLQQLSSDTVAQVETFATEHRTLLQTAGLVTAAVIIGGTGGFLLAKGAGVVKGVAVAKGIATAKGSSAAMAPLLTASNAATGSATLHNSTTVLNNSLAGGSALMTKLNALLNNLSANAVPVTAGAVGGGAAGVGATRYQVRQVKGELAAQKAETASVQAARTYLENALATARTNLNELQTKLAAAPAAPVAQDRLEEIKGIGRVFAQKLNAAGINTFADLAAQTPERLRELIGANRASSTVQPAEWIQQAQQRSQPPATNQSQ